MDLSTLKTQMMTMFMVKSGQRPGGGGAEDMYILVYSMMMMQFIEMVFKNVPVVFAQIQQWVWAYLKGKSRGSFATPLLGSKTDKREETSSITLLRKYTKHEKNENNTCIEKVDGIIDHLCNINTSKHIQLDQRYTLNTSDEIQISPHILGKVLNVDYNEDGDLEFVRIRLFSYTLKINELRDWIDEIHKNYRFEKNNKLGNKKYFFNEVPVEPQMQMTRDETVKEYNWSTAPAALTFTMNEFHTFKSFRNIFGSHVGELKERLDLFVHRPEWYQERGIPHSLGILLHGIPGAGKTSTIKAIAKDTDRHIFNLSLRKYTTQKQSFNIPLNKRIYVIEDIDCLTDIVYDRATQTAPVTGAVGTGDAIHLGFLLNLLDGVLETPGRILIITTNYPDRLDKALVRPGRIDVKIHFTWAPREMIHTMIEHFYNQSWSLSDVPAELDMVLSPAEVLECLCTYFKDPLEALAHMCKRVQERQEAAEGTTLADLLGPQDTVAVAAEAAATTATITDIPNKEEEEIVIGSVSADMSEVTAALSTSTSATITTPAKTIPAKTIPTKTIPTYTSEVDVEPEKKSGGSKIALLPPLIGGFGGSMFEELDYVRYNSANDIMFVTPEQAEEMARKHMHTLDVKNLHS